MIDYRLHGEDKMKVFISWSGERSCKIAQILKEWIPFVIQDVVPYFSSSDIDKGARWSADISKELEVATFGILCVTKENIDSPWLNFEAGALSKKFDSANVCPLLYDIKPGEITSKSPISQFQMTSLNESDIYKLFKTINACLEDGSLPDERLKKTFEMVWPNIEKELSEIEPYNKKEPEVNKTDNSTLLLENILEVVRSQSLLLKEPSRLFPEEYIVSVLHSDRMFEKILNEKVSPELFSHLRYLNNKIASYNREMKINKELAEQEINVSEEVFRHMSEYNRWVADYIEVSQRIFTKLGISRHKGMIGRVPKEDFY